MGQCLEQSLICDGQELVVAVIIFISITGIQLDTHGRGIMKTGPEFAVSQILY